ncbi:MAG: hypothetical protein QW299_09035 [Candidatus Caldarchaeum sp.]
MTQESRRPEGQRYRFVEHNTLGLSQRNFGTHLFRRGVRASFYRPSWSATVTTFRIFPVPSEDGQSFEPWRYSAQSNDFSDWIRSYVAAINLGDPPVTFLLYDNTDVGYDPRLNPVYILYNAISRAVRAGQGEPEWASLLFNNADRGQRLRSPQSLALVQGILFQHAGNVLNPPRGISLDGDTVVLGLTSSAADAMLSQMNKLKDDAPPNGSFDEIFESGDPVSIHHGRFVNFYQLGHDPRGSQESASSRKSNLATLLKDSGSSRSGSQREAIGYGCFFTEEFRQISASLEGMEEIVRAKFIPWDRLLYFPNHREQIELLSGAFPASCIDYAFRDIYPDLIPDSVKRKLVDRRTIGPFNAGQPAPAYGSAPGPVPGVARGAGPAYNSARGAYERPSSRVVERSDDVSSAPPPVSHFSGSDLGDSRGSTHSKEDVATDADEPFATTDGSEPEEYVATDVPTGQSQPQTKTFSDLAASRQPVSHESADSSHPHQQAREPDSPRRREEMDNAVKAALQQALAKHRENLSRKTPF